MSTNYMRDRTKGNQILMPWGKPDTISTGDAAAMMQCSTFTVRAMLEDGSIRGYQIRPGIKKSNWRVYLRSVEKHIETLRLQAGIIPTAEVTRSARSARPESSALRNKSLYE